MDSLRIDRSGYTLVDQVEEKLIQYFKEQGLRPGSSIPNENELAASLGIGRTVLREALSRFKMTGMIQSRTKRGMTLAEPSLLASLRRSMNPLLMSETTLRDIFEMRIILELGSADLVINLLSPQDIADLEQLVENEERFGDPYLTGFHRKLYENMGNKMMTEFQTLIIPVLEYVVEQHKPMFETRRAELAAKGKLVTHRDLLERIKAGGKKFLSRERKKELRVLCKSRLLSRTEPRPAMYGVAVNIKTGLVYVACVSKTVLELLESYLKTAFSSVPERIFPDTLSTLASEHPFEEFLRDLYIESMMLSLNAHKYHVAEQGKATLAQENGPSVSVNDAPDSARAGLESGLHIKSLKLRLSLMPEEEQVSTFTLHSDFSFTGLKTPRVKREKGDSDPDTLFLLKINYIEEIVSVMHSLFRQFCGEKK